MALVGAVRNPQELAKEFESSQQTIRNCVFQDSDDGGSPEAWTSDERGEAASHRHPKFS